MAFIEELEKEELIGLERQAMQLMGNSGNSSQKEFVIYQTQTPQEIGKKKMRLLLSIRNWMSQELPPYLIAGGGWGGGGSFPEELAAEFGDDYNEEEVEKAPHPVANHSQRNENGKGESIIKPNRRAEESPMGTELDLGVGSIRFPICPTRAYAPKRK